MDRRSFMIKLGKSLLIVAAATAVPSLLKQNEANACASDSSCGSCPKSNRCQLPKFESYKQRKQE
jgi:hypothetical protein